MANTLALANVYGNGNGNGVNASYLIIVLVFPKEDDAEAVQCIDEGIDDCQTSFFHTVTSWMPVNYNRQTVGWLSFSTYFRFTSLLSYPAVGN